MSLKVNRINRSLSFTAHLYFNKGSWNTSIDGTPRYYIKPIGLNYIERIGFTRAAKDHGYTWYGNGFWGGKGETTMNDAEALALFEQVKHTYPFGYDTENTANRTHYEQDVQFNAAYQSYYATYWKTHLSEVQRQTYDDFGNIEQPFPFIVIKDFKVQVSLKYPKGTVPTMAEGLALDHDYVAHGDYYLPPEHHSCSPKVINVSLPPSGSGQTNDFDFALDGDEGSPAILNASGTEYIFRFTDPWPKESGDYVVGFSGDYLPYNFKFSTNDGGVDAQYFDARPEVNAYVNGTDYTSGTLAFIESETVTYSITTTGNPDAGNGFYLDNQFRPNITLKRGSEYIFDQSDASNTGHPLYIGTDADGGDKGTGVFCDVQGWVGYVEADTFGTSGAKTIFRVPRDAPSILYYVCRNHTDMGGNIAIVDPTTINGSPGMAANEFIPGSGIIFKVPEEVEDIHLYYYSSGTAAEGQFISVTDSCIHKCEDNMWKTTGGLSGSAEIYD